MTDDDVFLTEKVTNKMIYAEIKKFRDDFGSINTRINNNSLRIKLMGGGVVLLGILVAFIGVIN